MKILVIEDKLIHRLSAEQSLVGHDLTVVSTYDEASKLMTRTVDEAKVAGILEAQGISVSPPRDNEAWKIWYAARQKAESESIVPFGFDVVLVDMMMPASAEMLSEPHKFAGQEVPYGFPLALRAAVWGAKFVAVVTDTNHHAGPMSASLDHLGSGYYKEGCRPNFVVNGAKCMFVHAPFRNVEDTTCEKCQGSRFSDHDCYACKGSGIKDGSPCAECESTGKAKCFRCGGTGLQTGKDWGMVLRDLTAEAATE